MQVARVLGAQIAAVLQALGDCRVCQFDCLVVGCMSNFERPLFGLAGQSGKLAVQLGERWSSNVLEEAPTAWLDSLGSFRPLVFEKVVQVQVALFISVFIGSFSFRN